MLRFDDSMVNACVYGVAVAAGISANHQNHSPNIFRS